ncbi:MAG TPA: hypothetical protein VGN43_15960 [Steroidobacteraceae bacterium]|jgi:hypothetical protein|nr:hypothetical protein [Steroidobacteraceae bacterium]
MVHWIQIGGALLVLAAFVLGQIELLAADGWAYLSANFLGAALLAASAVLGAQWGFLLLEGCWAFASLYGICRKLQNCSPAEAE